MSPESTTHILAEAVTHCPDVLPEDLNTRVDFHLAGDETTLEQARTLLKLWRMVFVDIRVHPSAVDSWRRSHSVRAQLSWRIARYLNGSERPSDALEWQMQEDCATFFREYPELFDIQSQVDEKGVDTC